MLRGLFGIVLSVWVWAPAVQAQAPTSFSYQVAAESSVVGGCVGPSICLCPAIFVSDVQGTVDIALVPLSMGPLVDYSLTATLTWEEFGIPVTRTGFGNVIHDATDGEVLVVLTIDIDGDGVDEDLLSDGFSAAPNFPVGFSLSAYAPEIPGPNACIYDGLELTLETNVNGTPFVRGDSNLDGSVNIGDPIRTLEILFGGFATSCPAAADFDDSDELNLVDAVFELGYLFAGGPPPASPFPDCGSDPTFGSLGCSGTTNCAP